MKNASPRIARRLPEPLPAGEEILWRGSPRKWPLAVRVLHVRMVAVYFFAILAWRAATIYGAEQSVAAAALSVLWFAPLALAVLGILGLLAYLIGRTTAYTITTRRLIMQFGVAFPMTLNLPFKAISSAAVKSYPDGTGDIPVVTTGSDRIAYLVLWPHARPWRLKRPEPMLRVVPDAARVAAILSRALAAAAEASRDAKDAPADAQTDDSAATKRAARAIKAA